MSPVLVIVGSVLLGVAFLVLLMVVMRIITRKIVARGKAEIEKRYTPSDIVLAEPLANNFGLESLGVLQARGNGALVLTKELLHFVMFLPEKDIRIPLRDVRAVSIVRSHLGKTVGRPLLHVRWALGQGEEAIAWWLPDVELWRSKLESMRAQ